MECSKQEEKVDEATDEDDDYDVDSLTNTEIPILTVNLAHVKAFSEALYRRIIAYPADIIPNLDMTINAIYLEKYNRRLTSPIEIRPFNADKTRSMRGLDPTDIDQLITITGMVTRASALIPEMRQGHLRCTICRQTMENEVDHGRIEEPTVCPNCFTSYSFQIIHNRSIFLDKQIIKLQESPDDMPSGQPHTITVFAHGALVESVQPGDRVTRTGIYRAQSLFPPDLCAFSDLFSNALASGGVTYSIITGWDDLPCTPQRSIDVSTTRASGLKG